MAVFTAIGAAVFGAGTFLAGATAVGLQLAAGVALNLMAKSTAGDPEPSRFSVQGKIQGGDDVPRSINFGWNLTAGSLAYHNTWGPAGSYFTTVIALGDMPIRELETVYVDESPVTLLVGEVHAEYGIPVAEYRKAGVDHLWIKFYDGTQTQADAFLVSKVSSSEYPYGSNRVGVGIPYVIATSKAPVRNDGEEVPLFQGFPSYKFSTIGMRLYDVSRDSSVGGDGPQRWEDPATWGGDGDFLPSVQAYNLLRGIRFDGGWLYGLQDVNDARLPVENWIGQINKTRVIADGPSGDEPTYRSGGEIQVGAQIKTAISALMTSCQGRLVEVGGSYKIHLGVPGDPVAAFDDGDIISTEEQSFAPFLGLSDTVNGIAASYPNPTEGWQTKTAPALLRPDLEEKDGNRRLMASVSLDMVPYPGQVQRLMKSALLEAQRARRHTLVLGPEYWVLEPGDIISWSSLRNGYNQKLFRVDGLVDKANLDILVDFTEVDPSDYDWSSSEFRPALDGFIASSAPPALTMLGWQVFPHIIHDDDGQPRRPAIKVAFDGGLSGVNLVRVQVRVAGEELPVFDGEKSYGAPFEVVLDGQFTPLTQYEVRGIFVREGNSQASWSAWIAVKTDDVRLGSADFTDAVNELRTASMHQLDEIERQLVVLGSTVVNQDAANKQEIVAKFGKAAGLVLREARVRATESEAFASDLTALTASFDGLSAGGFFNMEAVAAPTGWDARIAMVVRADTATGFAQAGIYLDAKSDGTSRVVIDADKLVTTGIQTSVEGNTWIDFNRGGIRMSMLPSS